MMSRYTRDSLSLHMSISIFLIMVGIEMMRMGIREESILESNSSRRWGSGISILSTRIRTREHMCLRMRLWER